jgi:hypothetical protein
MLKLVLDTVMVAGEWFVLVVGETRRVARDVLHNGNAKILLFMRQKQKQTWIGRNSFVRFDTPPTDNDKYLLWTKNKPSGPFTPKQYFAFKYQTI